MKRGLVGQYETISPGGGEHYKAFIPSPLPPTPALNLGEGLNDLIDQALLALGRLDSVSTLLPDTGIFIYMYVRKEAVLSSQIEGTQSSLSDLLLFESEKFPGIPLHDTQEVSNYVRAMDYGLQRLREGFPLSIRLIKEIHEVLLSKGRGSEKEPGEFRRTQNWIGGSRPGNAIFVPPPPDRVLDCMGSLEKFLHNDPERTSLLIKAALAHVQFETIHPFLDGNGRLGRLLITFILCAEGALKEPMLYMSLYFKNHRQEYYDLLQQVRIEGDWEEWLRFFMTGIRETADQAVQTVNMLVKLFEHDRQRIGAIGRQAGSVLRVHYALQQQPILTIGEVSKLAQVSVPTATSSLKILEQLDIVSEITGRARGKLYGYHNYIEVLNQGTEPL